MKVWPIAWGLNWLENKNAERKGAVHECECLNIYDKMLIIFVADHHDTGLPPWEDAV